VCGLIFYLYFDYDFYAFFRFDYIFIKRVCISAANHHFESYNRNFSLGLNEDINFNISMIYFFFIPKLNFEQF